MAYGKEFAPKLLAYGCWDLDGSDSVHSHLCRWTRGAEPDAGQRTTACRHRCPVGDLAWDHVDPDLDRSGTAVGVKASGAWHREIYNRTSDRVCGAVCVLWGGGSWVTDTNAPVDHLFADPVTVLNWVGAGGEQIMTLKSVHRTLALILAAFIVLHLANHALIIGGIELHLAGMEALRNIYRLPGVEHILIAGFVMQIVIGVIQLWRGPKRPGPWGRAQRWSGMVLAVFLSQHIGAALMTRLIYPDVDTNSYWAASVVQNSPFVWYFAPYYVALVGAMFIHIAAFIRFRTRGKARAMPLAIGGIVFGVLVVAGLMGAFGDVILPPEHQAYIDNYWQF